MVPAQEKTQYLGIYRNGELLEEHELILDPAPRTWSCLFLDRYQGEELSQLRLEGGDESCIDLLEVSDTLKELETLYQEPTRPLPISPHARLTTDPNGLFYYKENTTLFAQLNLRFRRGQHSLDVRCQPGPGPLEGASYALIPDQDGRMYSGGGRVDWENRSGLGNGGRAFHFPVCTPGGGEDPLA